MRLKSEIRNKTRTGGDGDVEEGILQVQLEGRETSATEGFPVNDLEDVGETHRWRVKVRREVRVINGQFGHSGGAIAFSTRNG